MKLINILVLNAQSNKNKKININNYKLRQIIIANKKNKAKERHKKIMYKNKINKI